jgi:hypothetical protein
VLPACYLAGATADARAWRRLLPEPRPAVGTLLGLRVSADAATFCLPSGALVAEGLNYAGLSRSLGVPARPALASLLVRRALLATSHAAVLAAGALLGRGWLEAASPRLLGRAGLEAWVLAIAAAFLAACGVTLLALRRWIGGGTARLPTLVAPTGLFLAVWWIESIETFVLLWLLGARAPWRAVLAFEPLLSLLRSLVVFLPAGLGLQDVGYAMFLGALGAPDAASLSAAFVVLKRSRELAVIAIGGLRLAWRRPRAPLPSPAP